jgi:hypothetical protein
MNNQEIEQFRTMLNILSLFGYLIGAVIVGIILYILLKMLKNRNEEPMQEEKTSLFDNPVSYSRAFVGFVYTFLAGVGLLAYQVLETALNQAGFMLSFTFNQALIAWVAGGIMSIGTSAWLIRNGRLNTLHDWYKNHPELRLMALSVALYFVIILPLHLIDPTRPMLDLMWLQSLLFGSLGLAWFHTFARLLMRHSYPTLDAFMKGANDNQEDISPNANQAFESLPLWLQLVISLFVLLCFVLVQAVISKIL